MFVICNPEDITCKVEADAITFQPCGVVSHHPHDIAQRYCFVCHRFMELVELGRELRHEKFIGNGLFEP